MSARLAKFDAVRARWQAQQRALEKHQAIAAQALADLDSHMAQLEQLRLDYRMGRTKPNGRGAAQLALLARFDVDLSQSLATVAARRETAAQQLALRQQQVQTHQRKLLGLDRYHRSLQERYRLEARARYRRHLNQVPWRGGGHSVGHSKSGPGENSDP